MTHLINEPIHFLNTSFAVHLMMVYYYLPFMTLPIYSSLEKFDPTLIEASMDLGATKFQTFRRVVLPVLMPAIRTGFFLVFYSCVWRVRNPRVDGGRQIHVRRIGCLPIHHGGKNRSNRDSVHCFIGSPSYGQFIYPL